MNKEPLREWDGKEKLRLSDAEWRTRLSPEAYSVLREKGTEAPFRGASWNPQERALYRCAGCALPLFSSQNKYDSGTGWPSFYAPISAQHVETEADHSHGMSRTEALCARCGSHLGHIFPDGPQPSGLRYCINSASLRREVE